MSAVSHEVATERRDRIVKLTARGWTAQEIADLLGVTARTVTRGRRAAGIAKPRHLPMTDDEKRAAKTLLDDGASYEEVARTIGRSSKTLARHLPGYTLGRKLAAEAATLGRTMARLERQASLAVATGNQRMRNMKGSNAA